MADLIDRAAIYDKLLYDTTKTYIEGTGYVTDWRIADAINEVSTVDAVEVVRCKDCKWLYDGMDD